MNNRNGFSLIRLIVYIALAAIAVVILFIALDPATRICINRNARRSADVTAIMHAVQSYRSTSGHLPPGIDTDAETVQIIGRSPGNCTAITCPGHLLPATQCAIPDLDTNLQPYLIMPMDPRTGSQSDTRYFINLDAQNVVTVGACDPESEHPSVPTPPPVIEVSQ